MPGKKYIEDMARKDQKTTKVRPTFPRFSQEYLNNPPRLFLTFFLNNPFFQTAKRRGLYLQIRTDLVSFRVYCKPDQSDSLRMAGPNSNLPDVALVWMMGVGFRDLRV